MKKLVAVAFAGLFATAALAQTATVLITPEQRTRIKEYVVKQKVAPAKMPSGFLLSIGATVPVAVELHTIPEEKYSYVMVEGRTALVEPGTRKVVTIID
jgi:hypothetical protein